MLHSVIALVLLRLLAQHVRRLLGLPHLRRTPFGALVDVSAGQCRLEQTQTNLVLLLSWGWWVLGGEGPAPCSVKRKLVVGDKVVVGDSAVVDNGVAVSHHHSSPRSHVVCVDVGVIVSGGDSGHRPSTLHLASLSNKATKDSTYHFAEE